MRSVNCTAPFPTNERLWRGCEGCLPHRGPSDPNGLDAPARTTERRSLSLSFERRLPASLRRLFEKEIAEIPCPAKAYTPHVGVQLHCLVERLQCGSDYAAGYRGQHRLHRASNKVTRNCYTTVCVSHSTELSSTRVGRHGETLYALRHRLHDFDPMKTPSAESHLRVQQYTHDEMTHRKAVKSWHSYFW